ncbi:MAG: hypothetical protein ACREGL_03260 [Alphaproteobacteria bacterium]
MKRLLLCAAAAAFLSLPAFAGQCPTDMKKIDEALAKNPTLSAAELAEVKKLRAEGEAMHTGGKHKESVEAMAKAKQMLKVQ